MEPMAFATGLGTRHQACVGRPEAIACGSRKHMDFYQPSPRVSQKQASAAKGLIDSFPNR